MFYVCLDVAAGTAIYVISAGEAGLTPGQLAIRILTGMALASAIVGGPDIMLYWQESGHRIKAEDERDAAVENAKTATKERDAAAKERDTVVEERNTERAARIAAEQERDAALSDMAAVSQRLDELSAEVEQLRTERSTRRSRRRRLRNNGQ